MTYLIVAFFVTFAVTLLVIRASLRFPAAVVDARHARRAGWVRLPGLRGFGRAGGIGILAGVATSLALRLADTAFLAPMAAREGLLLLACAIPVFVAGLLEDFTHRVPPFVRLASALVSAALAGWLVDAWVVRVDVYWADRWLAFQSVSVLFTCFAVAGLTNAFNIIDGFNGLASGVACLVLAGIAYVAFKVSDIPLLAFALTLGGAVAGFMAFNFPRGLIFLGDGGAYLLGFAIAELLVLLVLRHPRVSAWFPILLCSYPLFETLFSIYRRLVVKRVHPGVPDVAHLHHLIYKRLVRGLGVPGVHDSRVRRNAMTSPYLWVLTSTGVAPALIFWDNKAILMVGALLFSIAYAYGYGRIVKFRVPSWWLRRKLDGDAEPTRRKQP